MRDYTPVYYCCDFIYTSFLYVQSLFMVLPVFCLTTLICFPPSIMKKNELIPRLFLNMSQTLVSLIFLCRYLSGNFFPQDLSPYRTLYSEYTLVFPPVTKTSPSSYNTLDLSTSVLVQPGIVGVTTVIYISVYSELFPHTRLFTQEITKVVTRL